MSYYERDLPHWQPEGEALFITWRLHGSKPRNCDAPRNPNLTPGQRLALEDREWEKAATGYTLHAWVIMSNHVHILIDPKAPLPRITRSIKSYTARRANHILARTGPFWLEETYDRWIRTEDEFHNILRYIEENPIAAGLCGESEDYRWLSARKASAQAGRPAPLDTL